MSDVLDIWERIERSSALVPKPDAALSGQKPSPEEESEAEKRKRRRVILALDIVSTLFWIYVTLKIFVVDLDRSLVSRVAPSHEGILYYRVFVYLGLLVIIVWKRKSLLWGVAYVLAFPLLVLVWKIPWFFIKRRSWALFLGSMQAVFTALSSFKYNLTTKFMALVAATLISITSDRPLLLASAIYLAWLMAFSYVRLLAKTFTGSSFLRMQRDNITKITNSRAVGFLTHADESRNADVEVYNAAQLNQITVAMSAGIIVNKALYFWAYQLERYRREYSPSSVFAAVSYFWLLLGIALGFTFINEAAYKLDPSQYQVPGHPTFLAFALYSVASLVVSQGGGISAAGDWAYGIQLAAAIAGPLLLATFALHFGATFKRERDESALRDLVAELKKTARDQDAQFKAEWAVDVNEAHRRLEDLGAGLGIVVRWVTSSIPTEFFDDSAATGSEQPTTT
jgi:hypothetical protein